MKLNNQIYAFLLITLSTALTSVLAQQPVRIQTTVDSELASICGKELLGISGKNCCPLRIVRFPRRLRTLERINIRANDFSCSYHAAQK